MGRVALPRAGTVAAAVPRPVTQRKPSGRWLRRTRARAHEKLVRDLDELARLEPGGSPERPIEITSPAQVEVMALARPCPLCKGSLRLEEHAAAVLEGVSLRIARMTCTSCGTRRALHFRLAERPLH